MCWGDTCTLASHTFCTFVAYRRVYSYTCIPIHSHNSYTHVHTHNTTSLIHPLTHRHSHILSHTLSQARTWMFSFTLALTHTYIRHTYSCAWEMRESSKLSRRRSVKALSSRKASRRRKSQTSWALCKMDVCFGAEGYNHPSAEQWHNFYSLPLWWLGFFVPFPLWCSSQTKGVRTSPAQRDLAETMQQGWMDCLWKVIVSNIPWALSGIWPHAGIVCSCDVICHQDAV